MNHAGAYRTSSSTETDSTDDEQTYSLEDIRTALEERVDEMEPVETGLALGIGESYSDAHRDALDDVPDDTRFGDIDYTLSEEQDGYTAVALQYRTGQDSADRLADELDQLEAMLDSA